MKDRGSADVIDHLDGLVALEAEWWDLWRRCPLATPFASPAWAIAWWRAFAPGRLAVVTVRSGSRLVALAPLYQEDGPLGRRLLPIGIGITDYLDLLVDPDAAADASLGSALAELTAWESLDLEELPPASAGRALSGIPGCDEDTFRQSACPVLELPVDLHDPLSVVPAGQRRKVRMARHRAARRGGEIRLCGPRDVPAFLDELLRLHTARWAARGEGGVLADERVRGFHAVALNALAAAGLLHATTLVIEGRVAGAYYGLRDATRAYAYLGGFDPDFAFESPGTVLLADAVEGAIRAGAREFHFLRGQEPYKYGWGAVDRWNTRRSFRRRVLRP